MKMFLKIKIYKIKFYNKKIKQMNLKSNNKTNKINYYYKNKKIKNLVNIY